MSDRNTESLRVAEMKNSIVYVNKIELRDYFAAAALTGAMAHPDTELESASMHDLYPRMVEIYQIADAMLKAREVQP